MFRSVMMRKTILLVVAALLASAIFTTFAFTLAGKAATFNIQIEDAFRQADTLSELFSESPDLLQNEEVTSALLGDTSITGRDIFLIDTEGNMVITPTNPSEEDSRYFDSAIAYTRNNLLDKATDEDYYKVLNVGNPIERTLLIQKPITVNGETVFYLISLSSVTENNSTISEFVNILMISTLCAAFLMLVPVFMVVRRIVEPIQKVNEVARTYGQGDFSVRADETVKGEVGELAVSFNYLADRLSKSISDLTVERNRLKDIFDVISEGIVVVNEDLKPTLSNKTMDTIFQKVQKKNLFTEKLQLIPFDEVWTDFEDCIKKAERMERTIEGPNFAYQITLIPKLDIDNTTCIGATGFFRDISEELKLEKTRKDYVANISHELRTPLQTLRGLVEPLADGMVKNEEDRMRYYGIILHETMRLSRLIDDMLELSKLQSRTLAFKTFPFDLNKLLMEVETKYMPVMQDADLNFKVLFNTGELPTVMGNPDRVEQILVILMDNAKKYTPTGGSITISTEYNDPSEKVYISVIDTGQGIHEYDINHIFDRFFKADRARGKKGTGLGLAIAKELLTYMGEDITVESVYGEGTTFTFTLKRVAASTAWF